MLNDPDEELAIGTDKIDRWKKKKTTAIEGDLKPKEGDDSKSCWAHIPQDKQDPDNEGLLVGSPPTATCKLQALNLFILKAQRSPGFQRIHIKGVSVSRGVFQDGVVLSDSDEHVAPRFDETHRSLRTADPSVRNACTIAIQNLPPVRQWQFTRLQLLPLLQFLMERACLRAEFVDLAREILAGEQLKSSLGEV